MTLRQAQHRCLVADTRRSDFAEAMDCGTRIVETALIIGIALVFMAWIWHA